LELWVHQEGFYRKAKEYKSAVKKLFEMFLSMQQNAVIQNYKRLATVKDCLDKYYEKRKEVFALNATSSEKKQNVKKL